MTKFTLVYRDTTKEEVDHHLYLDEQGRIVIADHSADDSKGKSFGPSATDDGPLWVDLSKKISKSRWGWEIPVRTDENIGYFATATSDELERIERLSGHRFPGREDISLRPGKDLAPGCRYRYRLTEKVCRVLKLSEEPDTYHVRFSGGLERVVTAQDLRPLVPRADKASLTVALPETTAMEDFREFRENVKTALERFTGSPIAKQAKIDGFVTDLLGFKSFNALMAALQSPRAPEIKTLALEEALDLSVGQLLDMGIEEDKGKVEYRLEDVTRDQLEDIWDEISFFDPEEMWGIQKKGFIGREARSDFTLLADIVLNERGETLREQVKEADPAD